MRAANASRRDWDALREQDGELVAAEPRDRLLVAEGGEPLADAVQQLVAELVPERVVHLLEVVDVEQEHRAASVLNPAAKEAPVREAGQLVVVHLAPDPER